MKIHFFKLLIALSMTGVAGASNGQTVLLSEDFSSGAMPAGWSEDSAGVTPFYSWLFNNPVGRTITGAAFDFNFVIFDSEYYDQGNSEDSYLNLPPLNATGLASLYLLMDEQYADYDVNDYHQIEVSVDGGASWTGIVSDTNLTDLGYPIAVHSMYDISSLAAGQSNVMIRFHYAATWGYWWAIDNVTVVDLLQTPPVNDDCANAISLTVNSFCSPVSFTMGTATNSGSSGCNGGIADDDVWFSFTATGTSCLGELSAPTGLFHIVEVFDSCGGTSMDCFDNGSSSLAFFISGLTNGVTYYLSVYTTDPGVFDVTSMDICLMTPPPPPANNECAGAVPLTVSSTCISTPGTLFGADDSGIIGCAGTADDDVWYSFVAGDSVVSITVAGHGQNNPVIEVFDSCSGFGIACLDNSFDVNESGLVGSLTSGLTYYFRVYSNDFILLDSSDFDVCVRSVVVPLNDDCANAIQITPVATEASCNLNTLVVTDWATASTPSPGCSVFNHYDDVWYYFVATQDTMTIMAFNLSPDISPFGIGYTIYDSSCAGIEMDCMNPAINNRISIDSLTIGSTYYLRTFTANTTSTGSYNLCLFGGLFTGILQDNVSNGLHLFPDPTTGILNISVADHITGTIVKVFDMIGNLVAEEGMENTGTTTVDLSSLANGIYFVKVENENGLFTQKIVLSK